MSTELEKDLHQEHQEETREESHKESHEEIEKQDVSESIRRVVNRRDMRGLAFHFIYAIDRFDYQVSLEEVSDNFCSEYNLEIEPDSYALVLAQGVIDNRDELDEQMVPFLENWKLERLGCVTRLIIRMALYEFRFEGAEPSVIINEAVELAKSFAEKDAYKFINGLLDRAYKELWGK